VIDVQEDEKQWAQRNPTFVGIKPFRKPTFFFLVMIVAKSSCFLVMIMQKNQHPMCCLVIGVQEISCPLLCPQTCNGFVVPTIAFTNLQRVW
jgi:hypothetical protein